LLRFRPTRSTPTVVRSSANISTRERRSSTYAVINMKQMLSSIGLIALNT
jgi:hypothetical protein